MPDISNDLLGQICEQLDSFMGLMGYGREYQKIVKIVCSLARSTEFDFSAYSNIMRELKRNNLR